MKPWTLTITEGPKGSRSEAPAPSSWLKRKREPFLDRAAYPPQGPMLPPTLEPLLPCWAKQRALLIEASAMR
jgi:hypothetical protein